MSTRSSTYRNSASNPTSKSTLPSIFLDTKKERMARCMKDNCGKNGRYMCGRCRRMGQKLCRTYHYISIEVEKTLEKDTANSFELAKLAAKEIEARLMYEFVFDFISHSDLTDSNWLAKELRDYGHTQRMFKLYHLFISGMDTVPAKLKWMICNKI